VAAGLVAAGIGLVSAVPAHAGTPTITIRTPGAGQVFTADRFRFDGTAEIGSDGRLEQNVTVDFVSPVAGRTVPPSINKATNNARTVHITQDVAPFPWNGDYQVRMTATGRNNFLDGDRTPVTATRSFVVDAIPATPTGLKVVADDKTRFVTVSWTANTEPDRVGYVVQKQGSGGRWNDFLVTDKTSVTDESTAKAGGTYSYRVRALRRAAAPDKLNPSEPSSPQSASVDPPPPGATTPAGGDSDGEGDSEAGREGSTGGEGGTNADGSPATAGGTSSGSSAGSTGDGSSGSSGVLNLSTTGKIDLSDYQKLLAEANKQGGGGGLASGEDEGTYDETLPFGARGRVDRDGDGEADDPGSVITDGEESGPDLQSLGFLAGGLLATVLAMHVLWVRSEVNRADKLEVLSPEGPPPVSAEERFGVSEARPRRSRPRPPSETPDPAAVP
jgi:hypothetical protein